MRSSCVRVEKIPGPGRTGPCLRRGNVVDQDTTARTLYVDEGTVHLPTIATLEKLPATQSFDVAAFCVTLLQRLALRVSGLFQINAT